MSVDEESGPPASGAGTPNFGDFFWNSADLQAAFRADGLFDVLNPAWHEILGWEVDELRGRHFTELLHPDDVAASVSDFLGALERGDAVNAGFVNRQRAKDGTYRTIQWHTRVRDGWSLESGRDITDLVEARGRLAESLATTRAIIDAAADTIAVLNRDLRVVSESPASDEIYGYATSQRLGASAVDRVHPDDVQRVRSEMLRVFDEGATITVRSRVVHADGHWITLETRGRPLRVGDGPITLGVFIARDISQIVADAEALSATVATMSAYLSAAAASIVIVREDLRLESGSPGGTLITGIDAATRVGGNALDLIHPDDRASVTLAMAEAFASGELTRFRYRLAHADGHWIPMSARVQRIDEEGRTPRRAVVVSTDVTDLDTTIAALETARREAEHANVAKSEFLSQMSHELRTPLNSVLGFAQLLHERVASDEKREMTDLIMSAGQHLLSLINEVLDLSRVEAGTINVDLESVPLDGVVSECVSLVSPQAAAQGITIGVHHDTHVSVRADRQRLYQVVLNLLSNAIKYNRPQGRVEVRCHLVGDAVRLEVEDTGIGISEEMLSRLFSPFDRLGQETSAVEGTGLGLALSKRLVEAMGATIAARSQAGRGSTFTLELPVAGEVADEDLAQEPAWRDLPSVLYIEANPLNARLVQRFMEFRPHVRLISAAQGSLALELAHQHRPTLILLDPQLPDMPGGEVLLRLKASEDLIDVPVVSVAASADPAQRVRLRQLGVVAELAKPIDLHEFLAIVDLYTSPRREATTP